MTFTLLSIKVEITFFFVAFIAFILSLKAPSNVLITVLSSLIHEFGHLIMMLITGNKPQKLRFELTGINIIRNNINISTRNEILIALGGPLANAVMVFVFCIVLLFNYTENMMIVACTNLIIMTFNLLPIKRLDGGIALYYILSKKFQMNICSKILKITSLVFILMIFIWGFYIFIASNYNVSMIIIAIFLTLSLFSDNEC